MDVEASSIAPQAKIVPRFEADACTLITCAEPVSSSMFTSIVDSLTPFASTAESSNTGSASKSRQVPDMMLTGLSPTGPSSSRRIVVVSPSGVSVAVPETPDPFCSSRSIVSASCAKTGAEISPPIISASNAAIAAMRAYALRGAGIGAFPPRTSGSGSARNVHPRTRLSGSNISLQPASHRAMGHPLQLMTNPIPLGVRTQASFILYVHL